MHRNLFCVVCAEQYKLRVSRIFHIYMHPQSNEYFHENSIEKYCVENCKRHDIIIVAEITKHSAITFFFESTQSPTAKRILSLYNFCIFIHQM